MANVFDSAKRSYVMSRVRSSDTSPEKIVRSIAHKLGLRFRLQIRNLPGTPDLVFPRYKKIVFVHGCFWHQHEDCAASARPASHADYWRKKLDGNMRRDQYNQQLLESMGWSVLIIWECQTKCIGKTTEMLKLFFEL